MLRTGGMERDEIADAIGCSERTPRTYFLPEFYEGKSAKRAEGAAKVFEHGMPGSVPALRAFLALGVKADMIPRMTREPKLARRISSAGCRHGGSCSPPGRAARGAGALTSAWDFACPDWVARLKSGRLQVLSPFSPH